MGLRVKSLLVRYIVGVVCAIALAVLSAGDLGAAEITAAQVTDAIGKAKGFLVQAQDADGSWRGREGDPYAPNFVAGVSSLALMALLNTGMTAADPEIQRGLAWLRQQKPTSTYEVSLMIQALAAAKAGDLDRGRVANLAQILEAGELRKGAFVCMRCCNSLSSHGRQTVGFSSLIASRSRSDERGYNPSSWRSIQHELGRRAGN
jgi:hypothetical protein